MGEEKQLIEKVLKGDTSSFSYFVSTYQDMALTIAYRICKNKQDAEDIVQESFVRAFHNLHTFRFTSKFSTWLYRIVYNTAVSGMQTSFFKTEFTEYGQQEQTLYSTSDTLAGIEQMEMSSTINQVLDRMPTEESLVLTLFYLEENSIKDVALMLSITESNVKVRLHRGRKHFADLVNTMNLQTTLQH